MLKGVLTVGGWTMASRIMGFARDILIAALAGAGPVADAFFVANRLPNLFRRLFGEGAFNAAFVPEFSGILATDGPAPAQHFAEEALSVLTFWLLGLTIAGEIFMPWVMTGIAPGFTDNPAKFDLAVDLARIAFPYLLLICLTALLSGVLNGLDRFVAAAAAPLLYNASSIGAMLLLRPYVPTVGHALAWGVSLSGVAQLLLLLWAVRRAGMRIHLPRPRLTPSMRLLLRRMVPGLVGAGVSQINLAMDTILGSLLPTGSVSLLYYADRVNQLPLGTIGIAVGTALLPLLSRQVRSGAETESLATLNRALEYALFLTIPAAVALIVAAVPIMEVLFVRGAFDSASAVGSAHALAAYAVGLPAFVLVKVLVPGFFARGDTATPVRVGLLSIGLNLALNLSLIWWLAHVGLALASSLAAMFNAGALAVLLQRRGHLAVDAQLRRRVPRMALAAAAMALTLVAIERTVYAWLAPDHVLRWVGLFVLVGFGIGAYFAAAEIVGACRIREMIQSFRRPAAS
jgi:putative peptidoglycan lipid II flippase